MKIIHHLTGLQGNPSLWERAKFSLNRKRKLNNREEDVDVRNYFKDQLRIPENIMEDYQKGKGIKGGMNMGCTEHYGD